MVCILGLLKPNYQIIKIVYHFLSSPVEKRWIVQSNCMTHFFFLILPAGELFPAGDITYCVYLVVCSRHMGLKLFL